ncbi:hypothetical protein AXF42_Ash012673 [Apostasia shenzhenica]|uniref:RHOMBOID-like protein n=1 Tax=Apostasia shenzhenica TaxID=1088818 RepID=A0A2H9ZTB4_9ASPA|nr:hypothetical protein AXF42_Ash012673 [Apostasia shenzhenica]
MSAGIMAGQLSQSDAVRRHNQSDASSRLSSLPSTPLLLGGWNASSSSSSQSRTLPNPLSLSLTDLRCVGCHSDVCLRHRAQRRVEKRERAGSERSGAGAVVVLLRVGGGEGMEAVDCADVRSGERGGLHSDYVCQQLPAPLESLWTLRRQVPPSVLLPAAAPEPPPWSFFPHVFGSLLIRSVRIGIIYLLSGFGGSILSSLFIRNSISVGASGALFGLLGAMLSELITNWTIYTNKAAALLTLLIIIVINLAVGILPHVDNFAHIGGFLTGFLLGFVLLLRPQFGWIERHNLPAASQVKSKHMVYQYILCVIALLLLIAGFAVGLIMLFRGVNGNEHCSWCHYLTCVPTSKWSCGN